MNMYYDEYYSKTYVFCQEKIAGRGNDGCGYEERFLVSLLRFIQEIRPTAFKQQPAK